MISKTQFLSAIKTNTSRVNRYEKGGDGSGGGCDCIGLIIGAIRLAGGKWGGTHGSNWAARNAVNGLRSVSSASQLAAGEIVFKAYEPWESGYDAEVIERSYKDSPDKRDYYHVGVVTQVNPLKITHCTGVPGGIQVDEKLGQWRYAGENSYVNYDDEGTDEPMEEVLCKAVVHANNGYPVKMRKLPSTQSAVIVEVPLGAVVKVLSRVDTTWAAIDYQGGTGYMMRKFLQEESSNESVSDADFGSIDRQTLVELKAALVPFLEAIEKALNGGGVG